MNASSRLLNAHIFWYAVAPVTLILHLPERPLLPKTAAEQGVLVTSSELPLTLLPTDPLSDIRTTLNDVSDCYWLGAFVFRKAIRGDDNKPKKINGQPVLSDKLPEFTELHNIFDVTSENLDLYLTHGTLIFTSRRRLQYGWSLTSLHRS